MWAALQHPSHVEFFEKFHAARQKHDEDWMPMVGAVQHMQSLAFAPDLYAFTSRWRFHFTTAPTFGERRSHYSVTIVWRFPERQFHIAFGRLANGWVDDRPPEEICEASGFAVVIEPFVQRLLASRPSQSENHDG
jgi:hypothetical protein